MADIDWSQYQSKEKPSIDYSQYQSKEPTKAPIDYSQYQSKEPTKAPIDYSQYQSRSSGPTTSSIPQTQTIDYSQYQSREPASITQSTYKQPGIRYSQDIKQPQLEKPGITYFDQKSSSSINDNNMFSKEIKNAQNFKQKLGDFGTSGNLYGISSDAASVYGISGGTQTSLYDTKSPLSKKMEDIKSPYSKLNLEPSTLTEDEYRQKQIEIQNLKRQYDPDIEKAAEFQAEYDILKAQTDLKDPAQVERLNLLGNEINKLEEKTSPLIAKRDLLISEIEPETTKRNILATQTNLYADKQKEIENKYFKTKTTFAKITGDQWGIPLTGQSQVPETELVPKGGVLASIPFIGSLSRYKKDSELNKQQYEYSLPAYTSVKDIKSEPIQQISIDADMTELRAINKDLREGNLKVTPQTIDMIEKAKERSGFGIQKSLERDTTSEIYGKTIEAMPIKATDKMIVENINKELDKYYTKQGLKTAGTYAGTTAAVAMFPAVLGAIASTGKTGAAVTRIISSKPVTYGLLGLAAADVGYEGYESYKAFKEDKPGLGASKAADITAKVGGFATGYKWAQVTEGKPWETVTQPIKKYQTIRSGEKLLQLYTDKGKPYTVLESPRGYTQRTLTTGKGISPKAISEARYPIESKIRVSSKPYKFYDTKTKKWITRWSDSVEVNVGKEGSVKKVTFTKVKGSKEAGFTTKATGQDRLVLDKILVRDKVSGEKIFLDSRNFGDGIYGKGTTIKLKGKPDTSLDRYQFLETTTTQFVPKTEVTKSVDKTQTDLFKYLPSKSEKYFDFRTKVQNKLKNIFDTRNAPPKIVPGDKAITGRDAMDAYVKITGGRTYKTGKTKIQHTPPGSEQAPPDSKNIFGTSLPAKTQDILINIPGYIPTPPKVQPDIVSKFGLSSSILPLLSTKAGSDVVIKEVSRVDKGYKPISDQTLISIPQVSVFEEGKIKPEEPLIFTGQGFAETGMVDIGTIPDQAQVPFQDQQIIPVSRVDIMEDLVDIPPVDYIPPPTTPPQIPPIIPLLPIAGLPLFLGGGDSRPFGYRGRSTSRGIVNPLADYGIFFKRKFGYLGAPGVTKTANIFTPKNAGETDVGDFESKIKKMLGR